MNCVNRPSKKVTVYDCEECLTKRTASHLCFRRGFIWGLPDKKEPMWEFTKAEAENRCEDVSMYFDLEWEGNTHLRLLRNPSLKKVNTKQLLSPDIRWAIWERDNFACQVCGKRQYLSIDHIYPKSKGGTLAISNLQTLCRTCNSRKGNR